MKLAVLLDTFYISQVRDELKDDAEIAEIAAEVFGLKTLYYVSDKLRGDYNFVLKAAKLSQGSDGFEFTSEELRDNKEIVLTYLSNCGASLKYVSDRLQKDREVAFAAVSRNDLRDALIYLPDHFRRDKKFMLEILENSDVSNRLIILEHASVDLRDDPEFMLAVINLTGKNALEYASLRLQNDPEFLQSVNKKGIEEVGTSQHGLKRGREEEEDSTTLPSKLPKTE